MRAGTCERCGAAGLTTFAFGPPLCLYCAFKYGTEYERRGEALRRACWLEDDPDGE